MRVHTNYKEKKMAAVGETSFKKLGRAVVEEEVLGEGFAGEGGGDDEATMEDFGSQYSATSPSPVIVIDDDDEEEDKETVSTCLLFWFLFVSTTSK